MLLSKFLPSSNKTDNEAAVLSGNKNRSGRIPEMDYLLSKRDYSGAISLLEFRKREGDTDVSTSLWMGYCAFHAGHYLKAVQVYEDLMAEENYPPETEVFLACAYYFLNKLDKAKEHAERGPKNPLCNRLLLHIYNKLDDETNVKRCHSLLQDTTDDVLCLAAIHFQRSHFQEALDSYKRVLSENREYLAVNVYLALCYYKLEYYDVASDTVQLYLSQFPDSPFAVNVQACARYRLYSSKAADRELLRVDEAKTSDCLNTKNLIVHNQVVFHDGDGALITLPSLANIIPEARLNLIRFHLQRDDLQSVFKLIDSHPPQSAHEYLLQATAYYKLSIEKNNPEYRKKATELFLTVGESSTECDTVAGRQAMASANFLLNQLDEALIYLDSIKDYFEDDNVFNYNYSQVLLASNRSAEAEEVLLRISDPRIKKRFVYTICLVRAYCANGKGEMAWLLCSNLKRFDGLPKIYELMANDCYKLGDYYHSALAFDALGQFSTTTDLWDGKKNAIFGMIRNVMDGNLPKEQLKVAVNLLEGDNHPEIEEILNALLQFCEANSIDIS